MRIRFLAVITSLLTLAACSAHPGAGGWHATSDDAPFSRLDIRYDGKAEFYMKTADTNAAWRCFWSKAGKQTIDLKCIEAKSDIEKKYQLKVEQNTQRASLILAGQLLGEYTWQALDDA